MKGEILEEVAASAQNLVELLDPCDHDTKNDQAMRAQLAVGILNYMAAENISRAIRTIGAAIDSLDTGLRDSDRPGHR